MRYVPAVTLYIRLKNTEGRYAFEPVAGLTGRKPKGRYYLRHTNEKGKQKWVPLEKGLAYQDAIAERDSFSAGLLATD
jgi:hypothetical protein